MRNKINCVVLDSVQEDFHPIWEIYSVVKSELQSENEEQVVLQLVDSLGSLLDSGLVTIYEGVSYQGDQKPIENLKISKEFVLNHINDWRDVNYRGVVLGLPLRRRELSIW